MVLTPLQKFLVIAFAGIVTGFNLIWTGVQTDALALGLNQHVYNIGTTVLATANTGAVGLMVVLGLRSPTSEPKE